MKTNELEKILGITKHTLRYYEKEGLVHPNKDDNGYRNYSDVDIQVLQLVIFLRNLDISIDDIKGIINGDLTFKECITVNKIHLDHKVNELQSIQRTVNDYVEKDIPLIPALAQIERIETKSGLGYRKYNKEITLGKKPSKRSVLNKLLITTILTFLPVSILFEGILLATDNIVFIFILAIIPALILHYLIFGSNIHMANIENSVEQSIEFLSDEIRYYQRDNVFEHASYLYSYLFNKQDKYLKHVKYSNIKKVTLKNNRRYIRIGTPIATQVDVIDYTFEFNNGEHFYFYWPSTYDNDMQYIAIILKEIVKDIEDENDILSQYIPQ